MTGTTWLTAMGSMASIPQMSELRTLMLLRAATADIASVRILWGALV